MLFEKKYIPRPEHCRIFKQMFGLIKGEDIKFVADIGSGRTSLYNIEQFFGEAQIDAIISTPFDERIKHMHKAIKKDNWKVVEKDLSCERLLKQYDLVVAHLTISRAIDRGDDVEGLKQGLFKVFTKYLMIVEDLNHRGIKSFEIINTALANGYKLIKTIKVGNVGYDSLYRFEGQNDIGYLFEK